MTVILRGSETIHEVIYISFIFSTPAFSSLCSNKKSGVPVMCYPQCKGLTQTDLFNLPNNPVSQVYKEHFTDEETEIQKLPKITEEVTDRARIQSCQLILKTMLFALFCVAGIRTLKKQNKKQLYISKKLNTETSNPRAQNTQ